MTDKTSNGKYPPGHYQDGPLAGRPIPGHPAAPPDEPAVADTRSEDDETPTAPPEPTKRGRSVRLLGKKAKTRKRKTHDEEAAEDGHAGELHVPPPGGTLKNDRRTTTVTRSIVISASVLALLGSCGIGGWGATVATRAVADSDNVTVDQLEGYHVSTFDNTGAAAFAARYLDACLTRYDINKDTVEPPEEARRLSTVATMSAAGEDASCEPGESATKRGVTSATLAGKPKRVPGVPNGYFITMQVRTTDGATSRYSVPIAFTNPASATGPRVIGSVGSLPLPRLGSVDPDKFAERISDDELAGKLQTQFLPEFMAAWVASERSLPQFLAPGASSSARTGLNRAYSKPRLETVTVYPPKSAIKESGSNTEFTYSDGVTIEVAVTVDMDHAAGNPSTGMGYRLFLSRQGGHWLVKDVQAGVVSTVAGRKQSTAKDGAPAPKKSPSAQPTSAKPKPKPKPPKPKKSTEPAAASKSPARPTR